MLTNPRPSLWVSSAQWLIFLFFLFFFSLMYFFLLSHIAKALIKVKPQPMTSQTRPPFRRPAKPARVLVSVRPAGLLKTKILPARTITTDMGYGFKVEGTTAQCRKLVKAPTFPITVEINIHGVLANLERECLL